jgi:hypothetical protein
MKKLLFLVPLFLVASCSTIKVSSDYDSTVDFSKFKAYTYTEEALKLPIQELDRNRIIAAIDKEMTAKGFTKSSPPDVLIDLQVKLEQKTEATATNTGGYGYGYRYGYGGGFNSTHINVENYVVGSLFINMISSNRLVWQGRGTKTLEEQPSVEKKEQNINYAITEIFKKYPPKSAVKK